MITSLADLISRIPALKHKHQTIVLVTGVFDLLHLEHQNFLTKAKARGDILIVGLESDLRVKAIKGLDRPINSQTQRLENVDELGLADYVFLLPEQFSSPQDHANLIAALQPDILAVSSHTKHLDKKSQIIAKFGGRLEIVHQHNPAVSTTQIINQPNQS